MTTILNNPASLFLLTAVISFMGSVQPGIVNVMASRLVVTHGKTHAMVYSIAASIPEILYAYIASYYVSKLYIPPQYSTIATIIAGIILIVFGIYLMLFPPDIHLKKSKYDSPFMKGLFLSMTNPQLIIFWSGIIFIYKEYGIVMGEGYLRPISFSLGAAVGAFLLLFTFMKLTSYYLRDFDQHKILLLNKISAYILIIIGIIATLGIFFQ